SCYRRRWCCFTWVDLSPRSWFPTAVPLAVAETARAWAALHREEATLCRELDTSALRKTHLPVGYRWQNSAYCRLVPRTAVQLQRRPRVARRVAGRHCCLPAL